MGIPGTMNQISPMHCSPGHTSSAPATALMVAPRRLFQKRHLTSTDYQFLDVDSSIDLE